MKKKIIWESSPVLNEDDIRMLRDEMEDMGKQNAQALTDEEVEEYYISTIHPDDFDCERENLDIQLPGKIIVIADLGRWNGRRHGYKILGDCLNDILQSHVNGSSDISIYGDSYNILADECHHDGSNHYLYRMLRSDKDPSSLLDAIYNGRTISSGMLNRYTRSLYPYVADIYGWPCRRKKVSV